MIVATLLPTPGVDFCRPGTGHRSRGNGRLQLGIGLVRGGILSCGFFRGTSRTRNGLSGSADPQGKTAKAGESPRGVTEETAKAGESPRGITEEAAKAAGSPRGVTEETAEAAASPRGVIEETSEAAGSPQDAVEETAWGPDSNLETTVEGAKVASHPRQVKIRPKNGR